ncbi:hypothetical protein H9P43_008117 [Blastocladiella emersonii ATCC 22665]|nr:hypothetical protein H9P43_008117 [Blastocladiella emersonii ATCC 22665]
MSSATKSGTTVNFQVGGKPPAGAAAVAMECTNGAFATRLGFQTTKPDSTSNASDWVSGISMLCSDNSNKTMGWQSSSRATKLGETFPNGINSLLVSSGSVIDGIGYGSTLVGTTSGSGLWRQDLNDTLKSCFVKGFSGGTGNWIFNLDMSFICPVATTSTTATATASRATGTATATATSSATAVPNDKIEEQSKPTGVIIGGVAAALVVAIAAFTWYKRQNAKAAAKYHLDDDSFPTTPSPPAPAPAPAPAPTSTITYHDVGLASGTLPPMTVAPKPMTMAPQQQQQSTIVQVPTDMAGLPDPKGGNWGGVAQQNMNGAGPAPVAAPALPVRPAPATSRPANGDDNEPLYLP